MVSGSSAYRVDGFLQNLINWGFVDYVLPFLLVFTLVYAVLHKTKVMGEKKSFNVVIALVLGLFFIVPHMSYSPVRYPSGLDPVEILLSVLPQVSLVMVGILALLMLVGIWGAQTQWVAGNRVTGWIVILSALAVLAIFGSSVGWWTGWDWLARIFGDETIAIFVMLIIFGLIIRFVTADDEHSAAEGVMTQIGNLFKKP